MTSSASSPSIASFDLSKATLYYSSVSCGAASYISARLGGLSIPSEQVDLATHKTASGKDFYEINPKGNVPCLVLRSADGKEFLLNEGAAVLQFLGDRSVSTSARLVPEAGSIARSQLQNHLNYLASEVQQAYIPAFRAANDADREVAKEKIKGKLSYVEKHMLTDASHFLFGSQPSVADIYLMVELNWNQFIGLQLEKQTFPRLLAFQERISRIPDIEKVKEEMEQIKKKSFKQ